MDFAVVFGDVSVSVTCSQAMSLAASCHHSVLQFTY